MDPEESGRKKRQGKSVKELTAAERRKVEETIQAGLRGADTVSKIYEAVNREIGTVMAKGAFTKILSEVREGFLIASGMCRESLQVLAEESLRSAMTDKRAGHDLKLKAIDRAHRLFDLRRRPEEDREALARVTEREMTRVRSLSDEALLAYVERLKDPRMDDDFANEIEAYKNGRMYAPEHGRVVDKPEAARNVSLKKRRRKPPARNPKPENN